MSSINKSGFDDPFSFLYSVAAFSNELAQTTYLELNIVLEILEGWDPQKIESDCTILLVLREHKYICRVTEDHIKFKQGMETLHKFCNA